MFATIGAELLDTQVECTVVPNFSSLGLSQLSQLGRVTLRCMRGSYLVSYSQRLPAMLKMMRVEGVLR